ncbi:MAG TPA: DUF697 domain-containing protein [Chitinispirillaceae bacterium]|nr:DUF697 domain-containing protein [Chitinispirillaceae bacterium]
MGEKIESAQKIVKNYMWFSMGAGLIPVPFLDLATISGVQLKMICDLSNEYNISFSENRGKSILTALLGSIVPSSLVGSSVGSLLKMIPVIGTVMGGISLSIFAGAATYAIGKVFIQHFETGGTLLDFNPAEMNDYFKTKFQEGQGLAEEMNKKTDKKS